MQEVLKLHKAEDGKVWRRASPFGPLRASHRHRELELNLVMRGSARYVIEGSRCELTLGSLLWLFPAQEHVLVQQSDDFEAWILVFRPRLVRRLAAQACYRDLASQRPPDGLPYVHSILGSARARRLAQLLHEIDVPTDVVRVNAGLAYALCLAWSLRATAMPPDFEPCHPAVQRAAQLLQVSVPPPRLPVLAKRCGLSAARLSRLFKEQTGVTLTAFKHRIFVERFLERYGDGQSLSMLSAALEVGFGSYAQFHRVFERAPE